MKNNREFDNEIEDDFSNDADIHGYHRVITSIIRLALHDYVNQSAMYYESAKKFFFKDMHKYNKKGQPINGLDYYCELIGMSADYVRSLVKQYDR